MDSITIGSLGTESEGRSTADGQIVNSGTRVKNSHGRTPLRVKLIEKALAFSNTSSYRRYLFSRNGCAKLYRNLERDSIQGEANRALMRKDCFQANYNDYIPSNFDQVVYERDRLINIPFEEIESIKSSILQEKTFSIGNMKTPLDYMNSNMSFNTISFNKSFIKTNLTFNTTNQFSITTSNQSIQGSSINQSSIGTNVINQSSIGSGISSQFPINQSSIGSGVSNQVPINQSSIASGKTENVIVDLIRNGMSPGEVAKLSDVFQYPSCFRKVSGSIIPWLQKQIKLGYWNNNSSLFILCLTMALSVGSVETIFKLNSTWGGLIFLFTYLFSYLFIVQPTFCLELGLGQLYRSSPFEIFDKLVQGMGGVGMAMVILCIISACVASSRTCSEFFIYFLNVFKSKMTWDLSPEDIEQCSSVGTNVLECRKLAPLCYMVDNICRPNRLGKAYKAYQNLFDNPDVEMNVIDYKLVIGLVVTYVLVFILQMIGMTSFTFFAFILVVVIFFLSHAQVYFSMLLEGSTSFVLDSITKMDFSLLYKNSRIWTHCVRCCIYEYSIGNGIYSTLSSKSRIGYDLSFESMGVGVVSGYITSLQFFSALALVGYFCAFLKKMPSDILWMLEQDSSFVLLPMGFIATHNMERTLLVLQFCSCFILIAFTICIQIEVILSTLTKFIKVKRLYLCSILCLSLILFCVPLCSRNGKRVIWFLEIAVGDLGRVFMVLMTCIVIGWLYNYKDQVEVVGTLSLYVFNCTFWIFNIAASLGELLDENLPLYIWWIIRFIGVLISLVLALVVYSFKSKKRSSELTGTSQLPKEYICLNDSVSTSNGNNGVLNGSNSGDINHNDKLNNTMDPNSVKINNDDFDDVKVKNKSLRKKIIEKVSFSKKGVKADNVEFEFNRKRYVERQRDILRVVHSLFIGNIENFRKEFQRISPMHKSNNVCFSVLWSICIKWISCCLLSNSLADILEEIVSSDRILININTVSFKFKIVTIVLWLLFILVILLYPYIKKLIYKYNKNIKFDNIDLYDLPSFPSINYKYSYKFKDLFKELI